ncbi:DNA topoisomerase II medium subunit [Maribacter phage Molly_3]|nr:DNA topoisomerase II medium subunit [Maribacter phage Molly_3]
MSKQSSVLVKDYMRDYAEYVAKTRALPNILDGLKTSQRRIVYSGISSGLSDTSGYKKSASLISSTMVLHPHGDASIYSAIVRMVNEKYPLLDGRGNFGSELGFSAAASRYTEARLGKCTRLLHANPIIDKFVPNYDNSKDEPLVFVPDIPMSFLQHSKGIGVGIAAHTFSYNIGDVINYSRDIINNVTPTAMVPDFKGGIITEHSNGTVNIACKYHWEGSNLVLTEFRPYFDYEKFTKSKRLKDFIEKNLIYISNETTRNKIRIVIESKSTKIIQDIIIPMLSMTFSESRNYTSSGLPDTGGYEPIFSEVFKEVFHVDNLSSFRRRFNTPVIRNVNHEEVVKVWGYYYINRIIKEHILEFRGDLNFMIKEYILENARLLIKAADFDDLSGYFTKEFTRISLDKNISRIIESFKDYSKAILPDTSPIYWTGDLIEHSVKLVLSRQISSLNRDCLKIDEAKLYDTFHSKLVDVGGYRDRVLESLDKAEKTFDLSRSSEIHLGYAPLPKDTKSSVYLANTHTRFFITEDLSDAHNFNNFEELHAISNYPSKLTLIKSNSDNYDADLDILGRDTKIPDVIGFTTEYHDRVLLISKEGQIGSFRTTYRGLSITNNDYLVSAISYNSKTTDSVILNYIDVNGNSRSKVLNQKSLPVFTRYPVALRTVVKDLGHFRDIIFFDSENNELKNVETGRTVQNHNNIYAHFLCPSNTNLLIIKTRGSEVVTEWAGNIRNARKIINLNLDN